MINLFREKMWLIMKRFVVIRGSSDDSSPPGTNQWGKWLSINGRGTFLQCGGFHHGGFTMNQLVVSQAKWVCSKRYWVIVWIVMNDRTG